MLLLDEPLTALDSYLQWQVELELSDALAAFGGTAVYVSHSRDEVYRLCHTVCVLNNGKSEPQQPVRELFASPGTLNACLLSGCKNFSRARKLDEHRLMALDWGAALTSERPVPDDCAFIGVRAHYLRTAEGPGENTLLCSVDRVVEDVFSSVAMLNTPGGGEGYSQLRIEMGKTAWRALGQAEELWVQIPSGDIMLLKS